MSIKYLFGIIFFAQFFLQVSAVGSVRKPNYLFGVVQRYSSAGSRLAINSTGDVGNFRQITDSFFTVGIEVNSNYINVFEDFFIGLNYLRNRSSRVDFDGSTQLNEHIFRLDVGKYFSNIHSVNVAYFFGISSLLQTTDSSGGTAVLRNGNSSSEFDLPSGRQYQIVKPVHIGASIVLIDYLKGSVVLEGAHLFSARKNYSIYGGLSFVY